jgi:hypothetical protein
MTQGHLGRRELTLGAAALSVGALAAPPVVGQSRPFAGQTLNGAAFQSTFFEYVRAYFPEFEEMTQQEIIKKGYRRHLKAFLENILQHYGKCVG